MTHFIVIADMAMLHYATFKNAAFSQFEENNDHNISVLLKVIFLKMRKRTHQKSEAYEKLVMSKIIAICNKKCQGRN